MCAKTRWKGRAICAAAVYASLVSSASAGYLDTFVALTEPSGPYWQPGSGTWSWPATEWTQVTLPQAYSLEGGESLWLALENVEMPGWTKHVTLEYDGASFVPGDGTAFYWNKSTSWSMSLVASVGDHRKYEGTIYPQPGSEYVKLTNQSQTMQAITITGFTSYCVPEPATMGLVALGSLALLRRRVAWPPT